jgi:hypothetical protein
LVHVVPQTDLSFCFCRFLSVPDTIVPKGEGAIYVLVDRVQNPGEFIYVGSSTRVKDYPHVTIKGGMNRKYSNNWIHHLPIYAQLEAHF